MAKPRPLFPPFRVRVTLALALTLGPGQAGARTVEYLNDMAQIKAAAADQGIEGPFTEGPPALNGITLNPSTAADHRVTIVSVYCQAYGIDNPVSTLLADLLRPAADVPAGAGAATTLKLISGSTVLRCMGKNDLEVLCLNRVRITAEVSMPLPGGGAANKTVVAEVERKGRVGGFCGNIARYTGIVTREAAIKLLHQVETIRTSQG